MQTIEFEAPVEGGVIRIPERYIGEIGGCRSVKVILEAHGAFEERSMKRVGPEDFTELKIPTKGWKFDREEANAR